MPFFAVKRAFIVKDPSPWRTVVTVTSKTGDDHSETTVSPRRVSENRPSMRSSRSTCTAESLLVSANFTSHSPCSPDSR